MNQKQSIQNALIILSVLFFLTILGLPLALEDNSVIIYTLIVTIGTFLFMRKIDATETKSILTNSAIISVTTAVGFALILYFFAWFHHNGIRIQTVLAQIQPKLNTIMLGVTPGELRTNLNIILPSLFRIMLMFIVGGMVGGAIRMLQTKERIQQWEKIKRTDYYYWALLALPIFFYIDFLLIQLDIWNLKDGDESIVGLVFCFFFMGSGLIAWRAARPKEKQILTAVLIVLLLLLPQFGNLFQNSVLAKVLIFVIVGVGLNIVVGYAGLLDLGYVAFFAIGAYTFGLLAAPQSYILTNLWPGFSGINFWMAIPIAVLIGALTGILLGIPVLRLRGDYLAIVTLGFGEIIRLLMLNMRDYTGGPGGVLDIPPPSLFSYSLGTPKGIFYLALFFAALIIFISIRLRDSRIGRAWIAMREDEDVAEVMGINLVQVKLYAFSIGAAIAAVGGTIYAAQQINIFPDNFKLDVSIDILSLIIIGGMGSVEGVILGAIALIGLPEILRGVDEFRIVAFGALLITMMILRPEGLLPSAQLKQELHADDRSQDAWLKMAEEAEKEQQKENA